MRLKQAIAITAAPCPCLSTRRFCLGGIDTGLARPAMLSRPRSEKKRSVPPLPLEKASRPRDLSRALVRGSRRPRVEEFHISLQMGSLGRAGRQPAALSTYCPGPSEHVRVLGVAVGGGRELDTGHKLIHGFRERGCWLVSICIMFLLFLSCYPLTCM